MCCRIFVYNGYVYCSVTLYCLFVSKMSNAMLNNINKYSENKIHIRINLKAKENTKKKLIMHAFNSLVFAMCCIFLRTVGVGVCIFFFSVLLKFLYVSFMSFWFYNYLLCIYLVIYLFCCALLFFSKVQFWFYSLLHLNFTVKIYACIITPFILVK